MKTLQNLRDIGYAILKENENTSAYPLVLMDSLLNGAQRTICAGTVNNILTGSIIEKWPLPFLYSSAFYTSTPTTFLDGDTTVWATTLDVSNASDYATSGKLYVWQNIISYSGKTWNTFTGVTGILFWFVWGTPVNQLYTLPDDFQSSVSLNYNGQYDLKAIDNRNLYKQINSIKQGGIYVYDETLYPVSPFYTIIQGQYLLPFWVNTTGDYYHLNYEKKATILVNGTDEIIIPDEFSDICAYYAIGDFLYNRGEEARGMELLRFAYSKISEMYSYYTKQNSENIYNTRITTGKDQYLNI